MFHKAIDLQFGEGTKLELTFQNGEVKSYDMAALFGKYPQLEALKDRSLFLAGKLMSPYGVIWNDDLDIETETVYEDGITVRQVDLSAPSVVAHAVRAARAKVGMSQSELAAKASIDQSDISKIERGLANPSVSTLNRLADAMGMKLVVSIL